MRFHLPIVPLLAICMAVFLLTGCVMTVYEYGVPYDYNSSLTQIQDPSVAGEEREYRHYRPYYANPAYTPEQYMPNER